MGEEIVKEEFAKKSREFLTDEKVDYLAKLSPPWIDSEFVEERKKYLRKWKDEGATVGLAMRALTHANEYAYGTTEKLLAEHPELRAKLLKPAYLKALEISDAWMTSMLKKRMEVLGY